MTWLMQIIPMTVLTYRLENVLLFLLVFIPSVKGRSTMCHCYYPKSLGCSNNYSVTHLPINTGKEGNFPQISFVPSQVGCAGQRIWILCKEYKVFI